jgi:O-antigen ligase
MTFGLQLMLLMSVALGIAITTRVRRWRFGALAALALCGVGLLTSFTRSAWLALATSLAVMLGLRRPRALLALALVAVVAYVALPGDMGERLRSAFDPTHVANRERVMMWDAGVRAFRDHPVTGAGLQNLTTLLDRYRVPGAAEHPSHVHNSYLHVALATGVVGLAAFLVLCAGLLLTCASGFRDLRHAQGLGAGVRLGVTSGTIGFLLAALFDHAFGDEQLLFLLFTLAGLAWAARGWTEPGAARTRP